MDGNRRRDSKTGCNRWICHFELVQDISMCKLDLTQRFQENFGLVLFPLSHAVADGWVPTARNPTEPVAFAVVFH